AAGPAAGGSDASAPGPADGGSDASAPGPAAPAAGAGAAGSAPAGSATASSPGIDSRHPAPDAAAGDPPGPAGLAAATRELTTALPLGGQPYALPRWARKRIGQILLAYAADA